MSRQLDTQNEEFLNTRHQVRLLEEYVEKMRRRKVLSGEWTEAESRAKLQAYLDEVEQREFELPPLYQRKRDLNKYMAAVATDLSSALRQEKEYYFDESVGVSLTAHVHQLKERYPQAQVQTRRDRDGFPIVKVSFKPEFKYDLDTILAYDP